MRPGLRKAALTAHVTTSVGWLGAVAVFLVLAITGMTSHDSTTVRGAYLAMEVAAWYVVVPLAFSSLLTGLVSSLGTVWGLFRYYWVIAKLLLVLVATGVLLAQLTPISRLAELAATAPPTATDIPGARESLIVHATGGMVVLILTTVLAVYKPPGLTGYGQRRQAGRRTEQRPPSPAPTAG